MSFKKKKKKSALPKSNIVVDSVKCLLANKFVKETNNTPQIIYSRLSMAENYAGKKSKF